MNNRYTMLTTVLALALIMALVGYMAYGKCPHEEPRGKPAEARSVAPTTLVHMCRETPAANRLEVEQLSRDGWVYAGPLYNDGLNCTVTLWTCPDNRKDCETRVAVDRARAVEDALSPTAPGAE